MTLKDTRGIDDYFESLLDLSLPEHRKFVGEFKERVTGKSTPPNASQSKKPQKPQNSQSKKPQNVQSKNIETKPQNTQKKTNELDTSKNAPKTAASKKKTVYTNLYAQDGTMNDVILLKGRRLCNCEASKHKLINNCVRCGRIVCEQEGSGPCLFCGNLVCTEDELRIIESESNNGKQLKKTLTDQERPKGWEEAIAMRNRLIDYDRMSEKRTTVIDDESDYFRTNSVWLTDVERTKLQKLEEKMNEKKYASRREQKVTIDFGGRAVVDEPSLTTEFEDEIIKEIAKAVATKNNGQLLEASFANNFDDCDPNLEFPMPIVSIRTMSFFLCIFCLFGDSVDDTKKHRLIHVLVHVNFSLMNECLKHLIKERPLLALMVFTIGYKIRSCSRCLI